MTKFCNSTAVLMSDLKMEFIGLFAEEPLTSMTEAIEKE
jgi:hypothetical protein